MDFETALLGDSALALEPAGGGVGLGHGGQGFGGLGPSTRSVERIPAKSERLDQQGEDNGGGDGCEPPARGFQKRLHGNTFRSSSKCGPSRSFGQSPPHTMAVPWRTAAALKAAAMRG